MLESFQTTQQIFVLEDGTTANQLLIDSMLNIFEEVFRSAFPTEDEMFMAGSRFNDCMCLYWSQICERIQEYVEASSGSDEDKSQLANVLRNLEERRDFQAKFEHRFYGAWLFCWSLPDLLHKSLIPTKQLMIYVSSYAHSATLLFAQGLTSL